MTCATSRCRTSARRARTSRRPTGRRPALFEVVLLRAPPWHTGKRSIRCLRLLGRPARSPPSSPPLVRSSSSNPRTPSRRGALLGSTSSCSRSRAASASSTVWYTSRDSSASRATNAVPRSDCSGGASLPGTPAAAARAPSQRPGVMSAGGCGPARRRTLSARRGLRRRARCHAQRARRLAPRAHSPMDGSCLRRETAACLLRELRARYPERSFLKRLFARYQCTYTPAPPIRNCDGGSARPSPWQALRVTLAPANCPCHARHA